jgi:D-3-phosphoglycerate dehydrogenase
VGYVVMDIHEQYSEIALQRLNKVNGTIRCRVLF